VLQREKTFIASKLMVESNSSLREELETEKQKANVAERQYQQLRSEIDLIQEQLSLEAQNIEKCRKYLTPDEDLRIKEKESSSPQSSFDQTHQLTVSEQILLKYKRSIELRQFFERKYQTQQKTISDLASEIEKARESQA